MDHTTAKLQSAAEELQRCFENLLHEDDLHQRASSMSTLQYQSLKEPFDGLVARKDSAIVHWLQLSLSSATPGNRGLVCLFFGVLRASLCFFSLLIWVTISVKLCVPNNTPGGYKSQQIPLWSRCGPTAFTSSGELCNWAETYAHI